MNQAVDRYVETSEKWRDEIAALRTIALQCKLDEQIKWGNPCYCDQDANIILIHVFKEYCAMLFFKGALINDESNVLIQQTKSVQAARQMRFTNTQQIKTSKTTILKYIKQAIEIERAGLKVELKRTEDYEIAEEFAQRLKKDKKLNSAFHALTPGRQRAYLLHFSSAKQSKTREARIDKAVPFIMNGKGLNE